MTLRCHPLPHCKVRRCDRRGSGRLRSIEAGGHAEGEAAHVSMATCDAVLALSPRTSRWGGVAGAAVGPMVVHGVAALKSGRLHVPPRAPPAASVPAVPGAGDARGRGRTSASRCVPGFRGPISDTGRSVRARSVPS